MLPDTRFIFQLLLTAKLWHGPKGHTNRLNFVQNGPTRFANAFYRIDVFYDQNMIVIRNYRNLCTGTTNSVNGPPGQSKMSFDHLAVTTNVEFVHLRGQIQARHEASAGQNVRNSEGL